MYEVLTDALKSLEFKSAYSYTCIYMNCLDRKFFCEH